MVQIQRDINVVDEATTVVEKVSKPKPKRSKRSNGEGSFSNTKRNGKKYLRGQFSNLNKTSGRCEHTGKSKTDIREKHQKKCVDSLVRKEKPKHLSVEDAMYEVLNKRIQKEDLSTNTIIKYKSQLNKLGGFFKHYRLQDVSSELLENWEVNYIKNNGSLCKSHTTFIKNIFSQMVRYKYIKSLPYDKHTLTSVRSSKQPPYILSDEEMKNLLEVLDNNYCGRCNQNHSHPYSMAVKIQAAFGLRASEALGLVWTDVNFKDNTLTISHQLDRVTKKRIDLKNYKTKTHGIRVLFYGDNIKKLLEDHKQKVKPNSNDYLCETTNGEPIELRNYTRAFKKLVKNAGISSECTSHDLRHTYATNAIIKNNIDVATLAYTLGHTDPNITLNTYVHAFQVVRQKNQSPTFMNDRIFDL